MELTTLHYAALVFVVILVIWWLTVRLCAKPALDDVLYGFWTADDDEFCENAEIDSMMLFIGPENKSSSWSRSISRSCYLIIMSGMCNQGLTLTYSPGRVDGFTYRTQAKAIFEEEQLWDEDVEIITDALTGTLVIKQVGGGKDCEVYVKVTKQHDTTNAAAEMDLDLHPVGGIDDDADRGEEIIAVTDGATEE